MHELSIVTSLLDAATAEARRYGATVVRAVHCRIGVLRQVDTALLREAFDIARTDGIAQDARLVITTVGMTLQCHDCDTTVQLPTWELECPRCGSDRIELSGGDDLDLTSLEMEVPDEDRSPRKKPAGGQRTCGRAEPANLG